MRLLRLRPVLTLLCQFLFLTSLYPSDSSSIVSDFLWHKFVRLPAGIRPKIGIALGGGGARGMAHIGVLKALEEEKIPVDMVSGTSVGAVIGGLYVSGVSFADLENMANELKWNKLAGISGIAVMDLMLREEFISSEKMEKYLEKKILFREFSGTRIPFACVGCDIQTGEKIVFREGALLPAMRASSALPGLFKPVEYRHRYIVDGGIVENLPVDAARLLGADFVIAVDVRGDFSLNSIESVMGVLNQVIAIRGEMLDSASALMADFLISPDVGDVDRMDLQKGRQCIITGYLETKNSIKRLKEQLVLKYYSRIISD